MSTDAVFTDQQCYTRATSHPQARELISNYNSVQLSSVQFSSRLYISMRSGRPICVSSIFKLNEWMNEWINQSIKMYIRRIKKTLPHKMCMLTVPEALCMSKRIGTGNILAHVDTDTTPPPTHTHTYTLISIIIKLCPQLPSQERQINVYNKWVLREILDDWGFQ